MLPAQYNKEGEYVYNIDDKASQDFVSATWNHKSVSLTPQEIEMRKMKRSIDDLKRDVSVLWIMVFAISLVVFFITIAL